MNPRGRNGSACAFSRGPLEASRQPRPANSASRALDLLWAIFWERWIRLPSFVTVRDGVGLAFVGEDLVMEHLRTGALVRVLEDWCPPFLYYPSRRQYPAALPALIRTLRP